MGLNPGSVPDSGRSMRRLATVLLVAMAVLFVIARRMGGGLGGGAPAWGYVAAFAEAAMVGALADWFAVTALFRHPLGLPIPHTAIIPENKDRIAHSMAAFLRANFLIPQVVARRLRGLDAAGLIGGWLANPGSSPGGIGDGFSNLLADVLATLDPERIGRPVKAMLSAQIERVELAPLLGQVLQGMIADGRHLPVIEAVLRRAGAILEANEPLLRTAIHDRASTLMRWTRMDERVANALLDALYALLAEMVVDASHPARARIDEALNQLAQDLIHDPALGARVARIKAEALGNPAFAAWLDGVWERGRVALIGVLRAPGGMGGAMSGFGPGFGQALRDDPALARMVNRFARRTLTGVANRYGDSIVRVVSETVRRWDATTVTRRIEAAVGRDLQFIRINGTIVGGMVGLALHALEKWV